VRFSILTLFPDYFDSILRTSILARAQQNGQIKVDFIPLREFGEGKYRAVDDRPYGGGAGMVMMPTVVEKAMAKLQEDQPYVIYLSPQGAKLDAKTARRLATLPHVALLCGHYEGIDERAIETFVDEEISIGDFILTGGEPAAAVLIDAISRFVPGVVGENASVEGDTFEASSEMVSGGLKYPVFTRPSVWREKPVPEVLLSGNHGAIAKWRREQSQERTAARRPDLLGSQASKRKTPKLGRSRKGAKKTTRKRTKKD
jgi:tRNA (guanine37-N1)-methyltransferase